LLQSADVAARDRPLLAALVFGALRWHFRLEWQARRLLDRSLAAKQVELAALLRVGLLQLQELRIPEHAAVSATVDAAALLGARNARGLVNAVLRRYLREREQLQRAALEVPEARFAHPAWLIDEIRTDYPRESEAVLDANNRAPPMWLRVNLTRTTRAAYLGKLAAAGVPAAAASGVETAVRLAQPLAVEELPGFAAGEVSVQDLSAQRAAPSLELAPGQRVLDACAAPGGKTTHLRELADIDLVALDVDEGRLARVRENLARLRLDGPGISVVAGDAAEPGTWWDGRPFDRILADVPCTASGVVRRHPDAKWLRREADIAGFAQQQQRLLAALWRCLAPGGRLLYTTCSVFREENDVQIERFVEGHGDALRETITFPAAVHREGGQLLPSLPGASHNQDGFFYALLRKA